MVYFESCSDVCIIWLDDAWLQGYGVGSGSVFTHGAHNWLLSKMMIIVGIDAVFITLMRNW